MSKTISIKLTRIGPTAGPFTIYDQNKNIIAENVLKDVLLQGVNYSVDDDVTLIRIVSTGDCSFERVHQLTEITDNDYRHLEAETIITGCLWVHLKNPEIYHTFYGKIEPYIIEQVYSYSPQDQIVHSFKDYSKVYKYTQDPHGVSNEPSKIELDDIYFNQMIIYNNQQCSGVLNLVPKPKHNLKLYNSYPIYRSDSRDILVTKSDNFYNTNGFFDVMKDKTQFMFVRTCAPLSIDKTIHNENMTYTNKSFLKSPLRAKESRVRLFLTDRSDVHIVSQFTLQEGQISYK